MAIQKKWITAGLVLGSLFFAASGLAGAQEVRSGSSALATRVAPGESLPLTVQLSNFGSNARTDVSITYEIFDLKDSLIFSQTETVAVETSASYIKQIALPGDIAPGLYTARTSIIYQGQTVPATASQQFTVERKVLGIFESDAITGSIVLGAVAVLSVLVGLLFRRYRKASLFVRHEYSDVPKESRIYYEMLSDIIQQMRYHGGDRAIDIAAKTPGLTIDSVSGRVLAITRDPAEVMAAIVSQYQKDFGKKLNLAFAGKDKGHAIVR